MKEFKKTVVRALLPHIALTMAERSPLHGYGLMRHIRKAYGVYLGSSIIYPALADLEAIGLLESEWKEPQDDNDRPRKVYTLTNKGRITLNQTATVLSFVNRTTEV